MNYKIYMRGGEETAKVIKALQIESLTTDTTIPDYGSDESHVYGVSRHYQEGKLCINWAFIFNNRFREDGYIEVTPAQFYKTISGREWVSEVFPKLQKKKIYCLGSPLFKEILTELVCNNICEVNDAYLTFATDCRTVWGYSRACNKGKAIGYSENLEWFSKFDYRLVTPEEFYKIWSGKDWDCKESVKPEKKYIGFRGSSDVDISLLPKNIKNPDNAIGNISTIIYYIKDGVLCMVNKNSVLVNKIDIFDWVDFLAIVTLNAHITHSISEQIKTSIPSGLCIPQPSILETESSDYNKLTLSKKQTLKIVL